MNRLPLHALCPYFAMFPETFVRKHVETYSCPGDVVYDPFCGRGTTILESLLMGRVAVGSDISPVAYCVSAAKAQRPDLAHLLRRLERLEAEYKDTRCSVLKSERHALPPFFRHAFQWETLNEIIFLRRALRWKEIKTDRFIAALVLGSLHGEMDKSSAYFSNQMPRTICLKPDYSIRFWRERGMKAKRRNVFRLLHQRAEWRLKEFPAVERGEVKMTDARNASGCFPHLLGSVSLVVTSRPYLQVTRYEADRCLRLWFLGGPPHPTYRRISRDDRHQRATDYWRFMDESWRGVAPLLKKNAAMVVRIGGLGISEKELAIGLRTSLSGAFSKIETIQTPRRSNIKHRQAKNFLPESEGCKYELDFVFRVVH